jgi:hypothetical protein
MDREGLIVFDDRVMYVLPLRSTGLVPSILAPSSRPHPTGNAKFGDEHSRL